MIWDIVGRFLSAVKDLKTHRHRWGYSNKHAGPNGNIMGISHEDIDGIRMEYVVFRHVFRPSSSNVGKAQMELQNWENHRFLWLSLGFYTKFR